MLSDHDRLDSATPRPADVCDGFVRRMDPWWGYVFAGALLTLGCLVVSVVALIWITPMLGIEPKTTAAQIASIIALLGGLALAYVIFTRWRRTRTGRKRALIRDGTLARATVIERSMAVEKGRTDIDLAVEGGPIVQCAFNVWFSPRAGSSIRVLWLPLDSAPHILAFDEAGRMYSGHIKGVSRALTPS